MDKTMEVDTTIDSSVCLHHSLRSDPIPFHVSMSFDPIFVLSRVEEPRLTKTEFAEENRIPSGVNACVMSFRTQL
jgi:hypothetical protein